MCIGVAPGFFTGEQVVSSRLYQQELVVMLRFKLVRCRAKQG
jgi:hypothetical protein